MLYTYTPKTVGGRILYNGKAHYTGSQQLYFEKSNVAIRERDDGKFVIEVQEGFRTTKIISNVELEFQKHPTENYYFPVLERAY
ncbi:hypothetical protein NDK43_05485 [Neobacillus pocheonensis]|uniref:Uncharacterized protein n=1 Tax=Neobacillus pocheonensis TaxID=363869 RepID=A0ABT0W6J3_9BACI|nr:hypothetical protein [Neobacillus pocheonensis]